MDPRSRFDFILAIFLPLDCDQLSALFWPQDDLDRTVDFQVWSGSPVRTLNMRNDQDLDVDLSIFQNKEVPTQLANLKVNLCQIVSYFGIECLTPEERNQRISSWVQTSTLKQLRVYEPRHSVITFCHDGTVDTQKKTRK